MATEKQIRANRLNAQKSTGPKTPEGKRRSAQNARKSTGPKTKEGKAKSSKNSLVHGLSSPNFEIPESDIPHYEHFLSNMVRDLAPRTEQEQFLVRQFALCSWKMRTAFLRETEILREVLDETGSINLFGHPKAAGRFFRLAFYQTRDSIAMHKALALLKQKNHERTEAI